jgi:MYXO-CTERM domain-containing protein
MPGCGTDEVPSASPGGIIVLILALGALAFLLMHRMIGVKGKS